MRLAIFDVDGTLISGKSTEKRFVAFLFRTGFIGPRQVVAAIWHVISTFAVYGRHVFRKNKAYLAGLPTAVVAEQAERFVATLRDDDWIRESLEELRAHVTAGDTVVLMSGTLQAIIDELARHVGAHAAIGTTCRTSGDRYSGKPPLRHPFHDAKAMLVDELGERYGIPAGDIVSYADSHFDIPMLERIGTPVAVGPDRVLRAWAGHENCRIIDYG